MRILVAGPPKTGNVWVESLLATTYGLWITEPPKFHIEALRSYVDHGMFLNRKILHQHFEPNEQFFDIARGLGSQAARTVDYRGEPGGCHEAVLCSVGQAYPFIPRR